MQCMSLEGKIKNAKIKAVNLAGFKKEDIDALERDGHIYVTYKDNDVFVWYLDYNTEICISALTGKLLTDKEMDNLCQENSELPHT